jgi:hypothetical protein
MKRLTIMTAAILCGAGFAVTAARAEMNVGAVRNGSQCYFQSSGVNWVGYGYWAACATPANGTPAAASRHHRRPRAT